MIILTFPGLHLTAHKISIHVFTTLPTTMADKTTYNSDFCGVMADIEKKYVNKDSTVHITVDSEGYPNSHDATSLKNCSNRNLEEKGRVSLLDHFSLGNYGGIKSRQHEISASATVFKNPPSNSSLKRKPPMNSHMVSSLSEKYSPSCPIESINNSIPLKKASLSPKNKKVKRSCFQYLLPPAMSKKTEACAAVITPDILRLLTSKERISLFNRKTGKIMRGEDGISLKNLPRAMQNHAEYEIMLPACVVSAGSRNSQQSRTSAAGRIRRNVEPQYTIRTSKLEGKYALIVDGPHKGLYGMLMSITL
jgi:BRK domain.